MPEERTIKLSLRDSNGKWNDYLVDFVPQSKKLEYIRKEAELENRKDEDGNPVRTETAEYDELQAEFIASLFSQEEVTKEAILEGLDTQDFTKIYEIVRYRILGFDREEDKRLKKMMEKDLLAGLDTMDSKSDS